MKGDETGKERKKSQAFSSNASFFPPVNWRVSTTIKFYTCHQDADQSKTKIKNPTIYLFFFFSLKSIGL